MFKFGLLESFRLNLIPAKFLAAIPGQAQDDKAQTYRD